MADLPDTARSYGFVNEPPGTHTSTTMMLTELGNLLESRPAHAALADYRAAVVGHNVLLKRTESTRRKSLRQLRQLYGINPDLILFRALRDLWDGDVTARPLLALLCAAARDPIVRASADLILSLPTGAPVTPQSLAATVNECLPDRYGPKTLASTGRNLASTWRQSGHLVGRLRKVRARAASQPAAVAYALLLGHLCGARGDALFGTLWSRLLDAPEHLLREQALAASRQGWLEYRHAGAVTDISFRHLLRSGDAGDET